MNDRDLELLTPWSRLSRCATNVPLRQRLLERIADAMLSLDEGLEMLQGEPENAFAAYEEELRACFQILQRVLERTCD